MSNHGERHPVTTNHSNPSVTLVSSHAQNETHNTSLVSLHVSHSHHSHHPSQVQQTQSIVSMPSGAQQTTQTTNSVTATAAAVTSAGVQSGGPGEDFALHHLEDGFTDLNLSSEFPVNIKLENTFSPYMIESEVNNDSHCGGNTNLGTNYNNFANNMPSLIAHSVESTHQLHSSNNGSGNNANQVTSPTIYTTIIDNKDKQFHSDVSFPQFSPPANAEHLLYQR